MLLFRLAQGVRKTYYVCVCDPISLRWRRNRSSRVSCPVYKRKKKETETVKWRTRWIDTCIHIHRREKDGDGNQKRKIGRGTKMWKWEWQIRAIGNRGNASISLMFPPTDKGDHITMVEGLLTRMEHTYSYIYVYIYISNRLYVQHLRDVDGLQ